MLFVTVVELDPTRVPTSSDKTRRYAQGTPVRNLLRYRRSSTRHPIRPSTVTQRGFLRLVRAETGLLYPQVGVLGRAPEGILNCSAQARVYNVRTYAQSPFVRFRRFLPFLGRPRR